MTLNGLQVTEQTYGLQHQAGSPTFILMILLLKLFMATIISVELTGVSVFSWLSNKDKKYKHKGSTWACVLRSNNEVNSRGHNEVRPQGHSEVTKQGHDCNKDKVWGHCDPAV